jgi:DNA polymerase III alpha subunit
MPGSYNALVAFIHLRTHTEYSVVDGSLGIADIATAVPACSR